MIVHETDRLHERIDDRRADKRKPPLLQVLADRITDRRSRRHFSQRQIGTNDRLPFNKPPKILIKRAKFLLDAQKSLRVLYRTTHFQPIADNPWIL